MSSPILDGLVGCDTDEPLCDARGATTPPDKPSQPSAHAFSPGGAKVPAITVTTQHAADVQGLPIHTYVIDLFVLTAAAPYRGRLADAGQCQSDCH